MPTLGRPHANLGQTSCQPHTDLVPTSGRGVQGRGVWGRGVQGKAFWGKVDQGKVIWEKFRERVKERFEKIDLDLDINLMT